MTTLILTHDQSDFDAVASQVAAWKLEPDAIPVLAPRLNRNVRAFVALHGAALPLRHVDDLAEEMEPTALLLVDTQGVAAIREQSEEALKALPTRVIDHHARRADLPEHWALRLEEVGSTTTLLVEQMMERATTTLTWIEATLFLLGIHEDTGSLTYGGTTTRDVRATLWLMERGADLDLLRRHLDHPLTDRQRDLYQRLLAGSEIIERDGYRLLIAAARVEKYVDDVASLATSMRDLYDPAALVIAVEMADNVTLVARATTDDVNVGALMAEFGGGGHDRAAAAFVKGGQLAELLPRLRARLPAMVRPRVTVADLMSRAPIRTLPADARVRDAAAMMQRWGHEGFPVVGERGEPVGMLTRRDVDRALQHKLEGAPIANFMHKGALTVLPSDAIVRVEQIMAETALGQVPVVDEEGGALVGIITRTDLLKEADRGRRDERSTELVAALERRLPAPTLALLRRIAHEAARQGSEPFLVGGPVRDLLLDAELRDLDVVIEGEALPVARALARALGGRVVAHERFGTAKWLLRDPEHPPRDPLLEAAELPPYIDLITARTEFYERPTAMPHVEHASIRLDLHRRDFTINTLALSLHPSHEGRLFDFYGGERDLRERRLRVLHNLSFVEDPTRILRAIRFEQRFGLTLEPRTEELLRNSLDLLDQVSGDRLRHELYLMLEERDPAAPLRRMDELGVLGQLMPGVWWGEGDAERLARLRAAGLDEPGDALMALVWDAGAPRERVEMVAERLKMPKAWGERLHELLAVRAARDALVAEAQSNSALYFALRDHQPRTLELLATLTTDEELRAVLRRYLDELRPLPLAVSGDDLRAAGLPPGPRYKVLLDAVHAAALNGTAPDEEAQRALLASLVAAEQDAP